MLINKFLPWTSGYQSFWGPLGDGKEYLSQFPILGQEVGISVQQLPFVIGCKLLPGYHLPDMCGLLLVQA